MSQSTSDIVKSSEFAQTLSELIYKTWPFVSSGAVSYFQPLADKIVGNESIHFPFFKLLSGASTPANGSATALSSSSLSQGENVAPKLLRVKSWDWNNYLMSISKADPVEHILSQLSHYWQGEYERIISKMIEGIYLYAKENVSEQGELFYESTVANNVALSSIGETHRLSAKNILEAAYRLKGEISSLRSIILHSDKAKELSALDQIDYTSPSKNEMVITRYQGLNVFVSDEMPVLTYGTPQKKKYLTLLVGEGALLFGQNTSATTREIEIDRKPENNQGAGEEIFYSRREFGLHPNGFKYKGTDKNPADSDLSDKTSWERVSKRTHIKMSLLVTN